MTRRTTPADAGTVADTSPYPWPYDGVVDPARTALVICGSGAEWSGRTQLDPDVEAAIARLRQAAATVGMTTVLIRHRAPSDRPPTGYPTTPSPVLVIEDGDELEVTAAGIDGFHGSPLDALLHRRGLTHLLLAGRGLETAVHSTLRRANDRGYECLTVADACAAIDPACRAGALSSIEMSGGIFGAVGTTAAVLAALTAGSSGPAPEPDRPPSGSPTADRPAATGPTPVPPTPAEEENR